LLQQRNTNEVKPTQFQQLIEAHQRPTAQVTAGRLLLTSQACGALNDVSDGLASELWEIAEASQVKLWIDANLIPISEDLSSYAEKVGKDPLDWAFYGGEDYQLVGTADAGHVDALREQFAAAGILFSVIGRVESNTAEASVTCKRAGRQMPLPKAGFNHFGRRE
jgi:thiamine-monophosphate kinase